MNAIEVKNLSKKYRIVHRPGGYVALRDVLHNVFRRPLRFLQIKTEQIAGKPAEKQSRKEDFWALKNINLNIEQGEVLGIIGANGAGKSTLLKILSRITPPTEGEAILRGKVSSLLEIGTGFHPELTGRENIYLNGAILGMRRKEIDKKFNDIVEFSGVEKFLDTPVKRYSSGMQVRLAFSVAAHLEPDILLVDEVLAVGDAAFQKKSLGKMNEVTKKDGRTIVFVSHSMGAVQSLCKRAVLLENGRIKMVGETSRVIAEYLNSGKTREELHSTATLTYPADEKKAMQLRKLSILDKNKKPTGQINFRDPFFIEIEYDVNSEVYDPYLTIIFSTPESQRFMDIQEADFSKESLGKKEPGRYRSLIEVPGSLNAKTYSLMFVIESGQQTFDKQDGLIFDIADEKVREYDIRSRAPLVPPLSWKTERL